MNKFIWDQDRQKRTGVAEAVLCDSKTPADLASIIEYHIVQQNRVLLTRLNESSWNALPENLKAALDYSSDARTAVINKHTSTAKESGVVIVCAGTSDLPVAREAQQTLAFYDLSAPLIADVGVAGLWRLLDKIETIREYKLIIAIAGMEGALFSVLAGLVSAPVIAVPSSVGYGVGQGGQLALNTALGSCSPGILTVNIDNGYGAAISAIKIIQP